MSDGSASRIFLSVVLIVFGALWMLLSGGCVMMFANMGQAQADKLAFAGFLLICMSPGIVCIVLSVGIEAHGRKKRKDTP